MLSRLQHWLRLGAFGCAFLACSPQLCATTYNVVIKSPGFASAHVQLAFDLTGSGFGTNMVTLSPIASDGIQGPTSTTGNVSGTGPWLFSDTEFFNELLIDFDPLGTTMSFSFDTSGILGGGFPAAFTFFVLDPNPLDPLYPFLITTNGPGNALFEVDLNGSGADDLTVYTPDQEGYFTQVTAVAVPEPGSVPLLAAGIVAFFLRRRFKLAPR